MRDCTLTLQLSSSKIRLSSQLTELHYYQKDRPFYQFFDRGMYLDSAHFIQPAREMHDFARLDSIGHKSFDVVTVDSSFKVIVP